MQKSALRKRITPSVPFTLKVEDADGSKFELNFKLSFDFNAMAAVEEKTGLSMMSPDIFKNPSARKTTVLLWAGIAANHPEYADDDGLETIGTLLNMHSAAAALLAVTEAFFAALPKEQAEAIRASVAQEASGQTPADPTKAEQSA